MDEGSMVRRGASTAFRCTATPAGDPETSPHALEASGAEPRMETPSTAPDSMHILTASSIAACEPASSITRETARAGTGAGLIPSWP